MTKKEETQKLVMHLPGAEMKSMTKKADTQNKAIYPEGDGPF